MDSAEKVTNRNRATPINEIAMESLKQKILALQNRLNDQEIEIEAAREFEARYNALVDAFEGFIYICSPNRHIEYMNQRLIDRTGGDRTGQKCYRALHNRNRICPWCVNDRVFAGETVHWELKSPLDNRWYEIIDTPLRHSDGRVSKYAMIQDIHERKQAVEQIKEYRDHLETQVKTQTRDLESTKAALEYELNERKQLEAELRQSEKKYRQLVDNATVGIVVTQDGRLKFFNPKVKQTLGREDETLSTEPFLNFIHPDDRETVMAHHIRRLKGEEISEPYIMKILDSENKPRWIENKGVMITWNGAPAALNFLNDVTEQVKIEKQIRQLSQQLLIAQENERMRISRDLHDSVAQELSTLQIHLQSIIDAEKSLSECAKSTLQKISSQLKQTNINVRGLSYGLRPFALDQLGLVQAVCQHCEEISKTHGIHVDFSSAGMENIALPFEKAINIYRIIQEALNNVNKHADTNQATVRLLAAHPKIICRIQDKGKGFVPSVQYGRIGGSSEHMGLRSMEERARLMDGRFKIHSAPQEGTKIVVEIPIKDS